MNQMEYCYHQGYVSATNGLWLFLFLYLEQVFVFETFPKAYQFQVLQQHPGIILELKSF